MALGGRVQPVDRRRGDLRARCRTRTSRRSRRGRCRSSWARPAPAGRARRAAGSPRPACPRRRSRSARPGRRAANVSRTCSTPPSRLKTLVRDVLRIVPPRGRMPRVDFEVERQRVVVEHALPAAAEAHQLVVVDVDPLAHDRADDGVQSGAVATAGEDTEAHRPQSYPIMAPRARTLRPSTCSRIRCTPTAICRPARWSRWPPAPVSSCFALSDHDTVDGVDEALAAAAEHGLRLIPATELSSIDGDYDDLHVLGYGIDHHDRGAARRAGGVPRRPRGPGGPHGRRAARDRLRARRRAAGQAAARRASRSAGRTSPRR